MYENKNIRFDKNQIPMYFITGKLGFDDHGVEVSFNSDIVFDENQMFWKQNCVKFELVDDIDVINHFKRNFSSYDHCNLIKSGTKNMILEAYKQYGREKYNGLKQVPNDCIVFNNAIVYVGKKNPRSIFTDDDIVDDITINDGYILSTHNYFITNPTPYNYDPKNKKEYPHIKKLLCDWVGEDKIDILIEAIAYAMLSDNPFEEGFMLKGIGANDKTSFCKLVEKIIGKDNCTATNLYNLTENKFGTAQLYKKLVCFIAETDGHKLDKTSTLKSITGNDPIPAEFKNKPNFTFKNYATIFVTTNTIPQTTDKTDGWYRRWIIIDFKNKFTEHKNIFEDIPPEEYEAFANDCVDRLKVILKQGHFTNEPSIKEKAFIYERESNPLLGFINQYYEITEDPNDYVFGYEFYNDYLDYCDKNGFSKNITRRSISLELQSMNVPTERQIDYGKEEHPKYYAYIGIKKKQINQLEGVIDKAPIQNIDRNKEYTKEEIYNYFINVKKISKEYSVDDLVSLLKKNGVIYEPKDGIYKILYI